jgi:hypothetical protein
VRGRDALELLEIRRADLAVRIEILDARRERRERIRGADGAAERRLQSCNFVRIRHSLFNLPHYRSETGRYVLRITASATDRRRVPGG